jgi:outer membrane cobalamin receptor
MDILRCTRYGITGACLVGSGLLSAQSVRVSGEVLDSKGSLPMTHCSVFPDSVTTVSDDDGSFELSVEPGFKQLIFSFTGYETQYMSMRVLRDTVLSVVLAPSIEQLDEVVVKSQATSQESLFNSAGSGTSVLSGADISAVPVLGGEADLIKVLQLLPGTVRGIDGSSDLFVRGGAADQNLVLLDGTSIYNTSHLFGFVSVFNPDILESVESMNGGFPAQYGGRLSSILNVKTNSRIADDTHISGSVGLIASRLYIEQPIIKDKMSVWVAGRRTYADQVVKLVNQEVPYYFYDINAKVLIRASEKDDLSFSIFTDKDVLDIFRDRNNDGDGFLTSFESRNNSQSARWVRQLPNKWNSTLTAYHTSFKYRIHNSFEENSLDAFSDIHDIGAKWVVGTREWKKDNSILAGVEWTHHQVSPSVVNSAGTIAELLASSSSQGRRADELSVFGLYEWNLNDDWLVNVGIRGSMAFTKNKVYAIPEPRISVRYGINDTEAIKFGYSRMAQYMHRISYSAVTSPTDIWYPVTDSIRPQTAHQFSIAWQRMFPQKNIFVSLESYYKAMDQLIGLEEGTNLFVNTDFEPRLLQGKGRAYGFEVLLRKDAGKFTGWISYTLSWSRRQYDALNGGSWFPARYDRRHNGAIVCQYSFHPRWSVSLVWEYISGARFTPITGQYVVTAPSGTGLDLVPIYAPINEVKLSDAHRLDIGIKFRGKATRKFKSECFIGVYNVYNQTNPVGITIETNEENGSLRYIQPGLFGFLPFVSYSFKF